jgi:hypothetical protein
VQAAALAEMIDPTDSDDLLFRFWRWSLNFVVKHWRNSVGCRGLEQRHRLTGGEVEHLAASRFWQRAMAGRHAGSNRGSETPDS